jgi:hypothetical protein
MGGSPNGTNGEGGLLIIQCPNYAAVSSHWDLGANTYGRHVVGTTNGGHGIVTGGPQKVFLSGEPPLQSPVILPGSVSLTDGLFHFNVGGQPGLSVEIQASTNLVDWATMATLTNSSGTISFTTPTVGYTRRFYRARQLP